MQCQSHLPVYQLHYDLNVDANGGANPLYNGNGTFRSGHYNDFVSSPPIRQGSFPYKEVLRQTMLMHEVTFKDQVQELHRLYRKQEELMGEIKSKEVYMNQLRIEVQSSNSTSARTSAGCGQNTLCSLPFINSQCTPSFTGRNNIQISISSEREPKPPSSPVVLQNGDSLNDLHSLECKGKKIRGKLLDLELPAETYIDSDEEEMLEAAKFSKDFTPATPFSNEQTEVVVESDVTASAGNRSLLLRPCSFSGTNPNLADLNEPLETSYLEESGGDKKTNSSLEISERNLVQFNYGTIISDGVADKLTMKSPAQSDVTKSEVVSTPSGRKPSSNLGQNPLVVQALPSFNNQLPYSKGANICGRQKGLLDKVIGSSRCGRTLNAEKSLKRGYSEAKSKVVPMLSNTPNSNCIDSNSAIVAISKFTEVETVKKSKRCRVIDINVPCDLTADDEPLIQDELVGHDYKNSGQLNLNFCTNDSESLVKSSSLDKTRSDIDLEAPISPEVEERPPPREDSEENQPEEDSDVLLELSRIAAEAIVSFSSSKSRSYPETVNLKKCEASDSGNLEWFAGLVDSLSIGLEKDIDDFEAMTLELPEMKLEDCCCKNENDVQISSETCSILVSCQTRKGRMSRSKRKDFQREVLPSLASLSRYEVTEDIQMIEGLMEAAGTPWQLSRTRRACRMGRKPQVAKQQRFVNDVHVPELRTPVSWGGGVNRRPRGRRSPASPTILSKWFNYVI